MLKSNLLIFKIIPIILCYIIYILSFFQQKIKFDNKYIKEQYQRFQIKANSTLIAEQKQIYQFGDLRGLVLTLKNKGRKTTSINTVTLAKSFNNVIAVYAEDLALARGQERKVFLVLEQKVI